MEDLKGFFWHHGKFTGINWALYLLTLALGYKVFITAIKEKGAAKKLGVFVSIVIIVCSLGGLLYIGAKKACFELKRCNLVKSCPVFEKMNAGGIEIPAKK